MFIFFFIHCQQNGFISREMFVFYLQSGDDEEDEL